MPDDIGSLRERMLRWCRVAHQIRPCGRNPCHANWEDSGAFLRVIHSEPVCTGAGDADADDRGAMGSGSGHFPPGPLQARCEGT